MRHGNYGFRQENRNLPVTLTCFSFVMKNKEGKVEESVDSLTDIGDFCSVKLILNVFFPIAHIMNFIRWRKRSFKESILNNI